MSADYQTLNDGCDGDQAGLAAALGENFQVIWEDCSDYGYGHHSYEAVFKTADGRYVHAGCGGCSCGGTGDWEYEDSLEAALLRVPEDVRERFTGGGQ